MEKKKLSPAMATWARANRKMIEKSGTKKQRAMLAQLDGGTGPVKSGAKYARSITKGKSAPLPKAARNTKAATKKPVAKAKPAANKPDGSVKATPRKTKFQKDQGALTEQLMTPKQRKEYLKLRGAAVKRKRRPLF
tara:strand:- start:1153 stop:1560 length:408 start_codon:yes stop_codon:yes gene_type:complete